MYISLVIRRSVADEIDTPYKQIVLNSVILMSGRAQYCEIVRNKAFVSFHQPRWETRVRCLSVFLASIA
jgi:hypothetical protein